MGTFRPKGNEVRMALSAQVAKLSEMHDAMIDWLIINPGKPRKEMAAHFGVTQAWLSTIIHSDVFQVELRRRQGAIFNNAIARPIQERLVGASHLALDRLEKVLESAAITDELDSLTRVVEMLTKATGQYRHAPAGSAPQQNNQFNLNISSEDLTRARALIGRVHAIALPSPPDNQEPSTQAENNDSISTLPLGRDDTPPLSSARPDRVGEAHFIPSVPPAGDEQAGTIQAGGEL